MCNGNLRTIGDKFITWYLVEFCWKVHVTLNDGYEFMDHIDMPRAGVMLDESCKLFEKNLTFKRDYKYFKEENYYAP